MIYCEHNYWIAGKPIPLARPRFGRGIVYDSQTSEKDSLRAELELQHGNLPLWSGPIGLDISFAMMLPRDEKKRAVLDSIYFHIKRPDLSNLVKFIEDAAQPVLFEDDCIISRIDASKTYCLLAKPMTRLKIYSLNECLREDCECEEGE